MFKVDQYDYIQTDRRVYGEKIRALIRETGHSRNTIKKCCEVNIVNINQGKQPYPVLCLYLKIIDK